MDHGRSRYLRLLFGFALITLIAACGGSDVPTGLDEPDDSVGDQPPAAPSYSQDVNPIFSLRGCTAGNCHGGGAGDLTLTSSAATNLTNLVNVAASVPGLLLVEPNDAQNSYLVMKLEGRQTSGATMPIGGSSLTANEIATIRNWVDSGASNN